MPKLVFEACVDSGDEETDRAYLQKLQEAFIAITDLHGWGYTDDELFCRSHHEAYERI
jgi:hypothetical protein